MYLTILLAFLSLVMGIIGFFGLGDGPIPTAIVIFFILLASTTISFFMSVGRRRKKYYD